MSDDDTIIIGKPKKLVAALAKPSGLKWWTVAAIAVGAFALGAWWF